VRARGRRERATPHPVAAAFVAELPAVAAGAMQPAIRPRAYAIDPVPALIRMPGPSLNAAASAISMSPRTSTRSATPAVARLPRGPPAPGRDRHRRSDERHRRGQGDMGLSRGAPRHVEMTAAERSAPPGRIAEPGPSARARMWPWRLPTTTAVCDPPQSMPRRMVCSVMPGAVDVPRATRAFRQPP